MRVVYVSHCARLAGAELALLRLLPALDGVEPHVILGEEGPLESRLKAEDISVEVLPMHSAGRDLRRERVGATRELIRAVAHSAVYANRLRGRLRRLRPDLVHTNSLKASLYGGPAARLAGIPVVWHAREPMLDNRFPAAARWVVRGLSTLPDAVIADTAVTLQSFPSHELKGYVIPSPIAFDQLARLPIRDRPDKELVVGIVGRISPDKGQDVFLRAFARAFPSGAQRAVIVGAPLFGEEPYERGLRETAVKLGIGERVAFRGFREQIDQELAELDIVVVASLVTEAYAQAGVEGMAAGLPVVAPNVGGPAELIEDRVDGLLYRPGDVDRLAALLSELAADQGLRRRLGEAGRRRAARSAPEIVARDVVRVYERVLAGR